MIKMNILNPFQWIRIKKNLWLRKKNLMLVYPIMASFLIYDNNITFKNKKK